MVGLVLYVEKIMCLLFQVVTSAGPGTEEDLLFVLIVRKQEKTKLNPITISITHQYSTKKILTVITNGFILIQLGGIAQNALHNIIGCAVVEEVNMYVRNIIMNLS